MMLNSTRLFRRLNASIDDTHATHLISHCIALARAFSAMRTPQIITVSHRVRSRTDGVFACSLR